ncbi:MAG: rod shape-determining protein MreC [Candidatus Didemnitutus sp.]|nr:rod shape-determining protein MreC [Candidatus Didemnitutus sp.]
MPHQRFDQARPFVTLAVVILLWALLPLGLKSFTRASFFELQAPFAAAQSYVQDLQEFWALRTRPKNEIIEAGRDLARLNAAYELRLQESEQLRAELLRLENILKLPPMPAYRSEPARVARRDFSGWWQRLVIRKGRNHGITVGAPVVYVGGIVGRVTEVYAYTAVVDLITSPTFRVAASAEGDTRPISYQGGLNDSFRTPRGTVEFVPLDIFASASQPKRLVTSGLGGVFPPGLTIGEIVVLEPSTDGLFKSGEVRLDSRLGALAEVTVLVPLQPEEQ